MVQDAIEKIDTAAVLLIQALITYGDEVKPYLDADGLACVDCVKSDVSNLRRALLGAQMGPLYWQHDPGATP